MLLSESWMNLGGWVILNVFSRLCIKTGTSNVALSVQLPAIRNKDREKKSNHSKIDHNAEGLVIWPVFYLLKTLGNKPCFITSSSSSFICLYHINPPASYWIYLFWQSSQMPNHPVLSSPVSLYALLHAWSCSVLTYMPDCMLWVFLHCLIRW